MPDELTQLGAREFARHIDQLFGTFRIETYSPDEDWVETPVVCLFHRIGDEAAAAALKELDRRALAAQEWFRTHGPPWGQPLPVSWPKLCRWARIGKFIEAGILAPDNARWELLASFAISWFETKFDPTHPSFNRFARGIMAERNTPARLRNNPELRKEYPPKRLSTLVSAQMAAALDHSEAILAAKAANK